MSDVSREAKADLLANFLQRLSEWDVLNLAPGSGSDGPYWQGEIVTAKAALDSLLSLVEQQEKALRRKHVLDQYAIDLQPVRSFDDWLALVLSDDLMANWFGEPLQAYVLADFAALSGGSDECDVSRKAQG